MALSKDQAVDLLNAGIAKAFDNVVVKNGVEAAVNRFVQASLDALVDRGHLDVKFAVDVDFDPAKKTFFVKIGGSF
jgi:hypothetical protein